MNRKLCVATLAFHFCLGLCQDIPLTIKAGIGGGIYQIPNFVSENESLVFESRELVLAVQIDETTINDNIDKIPKKFRKYVKKIGGFELGLNSYLYIPSRLFLQSNKKDLELYGLQWDLFSIRYLLELNVNFAYMYISDKNLNKSKHFVIPGLGVGLRLSDLFKTPLKYVSFDLGLHRQFILPGKMYDSEFNRIDGYFISVNLLIPYTYHLK